VRFATIAWFGRARVRWLRITCCVLVAGMASVAHAADVVVVGLFAGKAVVVINGGAPRTLSVGQVTQEGVRLLAAKSDSAEFEIDGKRQVLGLGEGRYGRAAPSTSPAATLYADRDGHFFSDGAINGTAVRFFVDTGATAVAMNSREAGHLGLNYRAGMRASASTANGTVGVYVVKLDTVRVGGIELHNVEAFVHEGDHPTIVLLGMSFLNRVEMRRDGTLMTLTQRY
jgi:aspartyl protease family protein